MRGRRRGSARTGIAAALTALVLALAGCGGSGGVADTAEEMGHVHGLGVNPADGALMIATHVGLFRLSGGGDPVRVGEGRQDLMGFVVEGPDRFLASGHPAPGGDGPPHLGLVRSVDGGASWTGVSLSGQADFHRIRAVGDTVVAVDSTSGLLMTSGDGGRTWSSARPPEPLIDVAPDPSDARRLVATTETGVLSSADGGGTWRRLEGPAGLLAWPAPGRLFLVDAGGAVWTSSRRGQDFRAAGSIGGAPAALAADGETLFAGRHDGAIVRSDDGGTSWQAIASG